MRRSIQNKVEALYQQHIIQKAIEPTQTPNSEENIAAIAKGRFDPQGHWLTEVTLDEDDYEAILQQAAEEQKEEEEEEEEIKVEETSSQPTALHGGEHPNKQKLENLLGSPGYPCEITDTTYCNLDIRKFPNLKDEFISWVKSNPRPGTTQKQVGKISDAARWLLDSNNGGSVIALQEEMEMHLRLITHALQKAIQGEDDPIVADGGWPAINIALAKQMNQQVRHAYQQALLKSFVVVDASCSVDIKILNHALNQSRESVSEEAHENILAEIVKHHHHHGDRQAPEITEIFLEKLSKIVADSGINEHLFESTTAIDFDYLRTDERNATVTRISGSNMTAHNKLLGEEMADRRVFRNCYETGFLIEQTGWILGDPVLRVKPIDDQSIEIRIPSIAVLKGEDEKDIPDDDIIADVVLKLEALHQKAFGVEDGVLIYNLLTSLPPQYRDPSNLQTKSARCILAGAHRYNKDNPEKLVLVQNIGVNKSDADLQSEEFVLRKSIQHHQGTVHEACLMSELALMHTLCENKDFLDVMDKDKGKLEGFYGKSINQYKAYLTGIAGGIEKQQFKLSPHSVALISYLRDKTDDKGEPLCLLENLELTVADGASLKTLAAKTLYKIFLRGDYKNGQYGMLVQALSVYLEKVSIYGCKSANDRYAAVSGRVELLNSIQYRSEVQGAPFLSQEEKSLMNALLAFIRGDTNNITLTTVQSALDASFNQHNLQGSSNAICHMDTGAGPKGQVNRGGLEYFNTNHFEPPELTNLHQGCTGALQSHNNNHTKKLNDAGITMMQRYPVGSLYCDENEFWRHIQNTVKNATKKVAQRKMTFSSAQETSSVSLSSAAGGSSSSNQAPTAVRQWSFSNVKETATLSAPISAGGSSSSNQAPTTVRQRLYHLMMQQVVLYDDEKGVNSYFTDMDYGKKMYVRDARGLGSAETLDEERARHLEDTYYKQQKNKTSRQWLIMGINYTLALATLLETQPQQQLEGDLLDDQQLLQPSQKPELEKKLYNLAKKFVANAEAVVAPGSPHPSTIKDAYQAYFLLYVRYILASIMEKYLPGICKNRSGVFDSEKAIKRLDDAKDWAAMEMPSFYIATISQLTEPGSSVGDTMGTGCVVQFESPVTAMTEEQLDQLDDYKTSTWYKQLNSVEKGLCDYYVPEIQRQDRVLTSQLRDRLGVGLRNAYYSQTFYSSKYGDHEIFGLGHSGCLPIVYKNINKIEKESSLLYAQSINKDKTTQESGEIRENRAKQDSKLEALDAQMLQTAKSNLEQQRQFAQNFTQDDRALGVNLGDSPSPLATLSIILNTKNRAAQILKDATDQLITVNSKKACEKVANSLYARLPVALGVLEQSNFHNLEQFKNETNRLCNTLKEAGVDVNFIQGLEQVNYKLSCYIGVLRRHTTSARNHDGINIAADAMVAVYLRNSMRRYLLKSGCEELVGIGANILEIIAFVRCASGDNRTQDAVLYAIIEALKRVTIIDIKRITALLAFNGHAVAMTGAGAQGCNMGTGGIRFQSFNAFPVERGNLSYLGSGENTFGEIVKRVLVTDESDQKKASAKVSPIGDLNEKEQFILAMFNDMDGSHVLFTKGLMDGLALIIQGQQRWRYSEVGRSSIIRDSLQSLRSAASSLFCCFSSSRESRTGSLREHLIPANNNRGKI